MEKPVVKLIGGDSNILSIMGKCSIELRKVGQAAEAKELSEIVWASSSYSESLSICMEYIEVDKVPVWSLFNPSVFLPCLVPV
jgi:hypothetical protein